MTTEQDGGKVVSLTRRPPLTPGNIPGTHFCQRLSRPQDHSATGRIIIIIIIIIIIGIQPLGRFGQRPELSQATGIALVHCILGKFLGVVCHCFTPEGLCL